MAGTRRSGNLILVVSVLTLIIGIALVAVVLRNADDGGGVGASGDGETVPVLVAKSAIAKGSTSDKVLGQVEVKQVPAAQRAADAFVAPTDIQDRVAITDISSGDQVRASYFTDRTLRGSDILLPEGKQAVAVTIETTPGGAGYIGRGDYVDLFATYGSYGTVDPARPTSNPRPGDAIVPQQDCGTYAVFLPGGVPAGGVPPKLDLKALCAARLVLSNVLVLERSFEQAPLGTGAGAGTTPATVAPGAPASAARTPTTDRITFLLAVDAPAAERVIFLTSYAKLYLTLKPRGTNGQPAQPPSLTPGRDELNALKP